MKNIIKKPLIIACALAISSTGFAADEAIDKHTLLKSAQALFQILPTEAQLDDANPATDKQIELGRKLFFDPRLSLRGNISCNTCHNLATYGVDNLSFSPGTAGALGGRNAPTVLNAAVLGSQFWDGRAQDVEEQAGGPLLNPIEMALPDEETAIKRVASIPGYQKDFKDAYGGEEAINFKNITHAIAAFERTLMTPSKWDKFLDGDVDALNEKELAGLQKFINFGCIACHKGVALGGESFQKFGLVKSPYWEFTKSKGHDEGRFEVTSQESDKFFFRVPQLRNIEHTYPYFHDGSVWTLEDAVSIMGYAQLGKELSKEEIDDVVTFLNALTGPVTDEMRQLPQLPKSGERTIPMEYPQ